MCHFFKIMTIGALLALSSISVDAQVTIGSDEKALQGAMLDLKQEDKQDGSANSLRGLGLPRVVLNYLRIPTGETSLSTTIDQASGEWDADDHIGLVIYNINVKYEPCPIDQSIVDTDKEITPGTYVWDGKKWQYIGALANRIVKKDESVEYVTDARDGEKYPYRAFGDPNDPENFAGYWTLENTRYIDRSMTFGVANSMIDKTYIYPNGGSEGNPPVTWMPSQGILYSYAAATLGGQDDLWSNDEYPQQGQEVGGEETTRIMQGVCPEGWHVPTDREWNKLAKVIYNNPTEYSEYTSAFTTPWDEDWEIEGGGAQQGMSDGENGLGIAMLATCTSLFINESGEIDRKPSIGKSKTSLGGGFNALFLGMDDGTYRDAAGFWTSSIAGGDYGEAAWGRAILAEEPLGLLRSQGSQNHFSSVRCKKD